jgi:signal transduction histidine kinase
MAYPLEATNTRVASRARVVITNRVGLHTADHPVVDPAGQAVALERARIAREIHDGALQDAYAAQLELARLRSMPELTPDVLAAVDLLRAAVGAMAGDIRQVVDELHHGRTDELPFARRAAEHATRLTQHFGVISVVDLKGLPPLPAAVDCELGRIVQEAMTNAAKHAGPCQITVRGRRRAGGWIVSVTDDGPGFDPAAQGARFGLQGMAARAALIGARLAIDSVHGKGAEIRVVYP